MPHTMATEKSSWITNLKINYDFAVDGLRHLSVSILLNAFSVHVISSPSLLKDVRKWKFYLLLDFERVPNDLWHRDFQEFDLRSQQNCLASFWCWYIVWNRKESCSTICQRWMYRTFQRDLKFIAILITGWQERNESSYFARVVREHWPAMLLPCTVTSLSYFPSRNT